MLCDVFEINFNATLLKLDLSATQSVSITELSIVCLGKWNKKIFTPTWVTANLFGTTNVPIGGVVNPVEIEITYTSEEIQFTAKDNAIEIMLVIPQVETELIAKIQRASELFNKTLQLLPQTPITGIGFNVRYQVHKDFDSNFFNKVKDSFKPLDQTFLAGSFRYQKRINDYKRLNCIVEQNSDDHFLINFNLHHEKLGEDLFKPIFNDLYFESKSLIYG